MTNIKILPPNSVNDPIMKLMSSKTKTRVLFKAPLLTQSGYGVHARQVAKWLLQFRSSNPDSIEVKFDPTSWGSTPWYVTATEDEPVIQQIYSNTIKAAGEPFDISIQLLLPNEWTTDRAAVNIGMTAGVEADTCNPLWIQACNKMTMVIVPSEFTKKMFFDTAKKFNMEITVPMVVVPESYYVSGQDIWAEASVDKKLEAVDTSTNFLIVGQMTGDSFLNDRKNIGYTLRWLCEAFEGKPDVGIIIKTNAGRHTKVDQKMVEQLVNQTISEIAYIISQEKARSKSKDKSVRLPSVYLVHGAMANREMMQLYQHPKVSALVSLTHGEGFGLPLLEAASVGCPVIATDWSAHTEFLNKGKWMKVQSTLETIHASRADANIWMKDAQWAMPQEESFKKTLNKFMIGRDVPLKWAEDLQKKIAQFYSPDQINQKYDEVLGQLILDTHQKKHGEADPLLLPSSSSS